MLQKIDRKTKRLLDLASAIEKAEDFDQGSWQHCICGQAVKLYAGFFNGLPGVEGHHAWGSNVLGIPYEDALVLFSNATCGSPTREHAGSVVRHYALTGIVDWGVGQAR